MRRLLFPALVALFFGGCGPKILLNDFTPAPLEKAAIMPSPAELERKKPRVVVLPFVERAALAREAHVGSPVASGIESLLSLSRSVEPVDRSAATHLQEELALIEMKGQTNLCSEPVPADMAVGGTIESVQHQSRYTESKTFCNKKGKCTTYPESCDYSAELAATLKIYTLPELKLLFSLPLNGSSGYREEGRCRDYDAVALAAQAAVNTPESGRVALLNFFSPRGFITEKRRSGDKTIFLVQLGSNQGAAYNLRIRLYTKTLSTNPLTGETTTQESYLGEGKITDQITPDTAWILVTNEELAKRIRLGDYVTFDHTKNLSDLFIDHTQ